MGNVQAGMGTPLAALQQAVSALLQKGSFRFDQNTRSLIRDTEMALRTSINQQRHQEAVNQSMGMELYWYDKQQETYIKISKALGLDQEGNPRPGCIFLAAPS